jgi:hypothetical protein
MLPRLGSADGTPPFAGAAARSCCKEWFVANAISDDCERRVIVQTGEGRKDARMPIPGLAWPNVKTPHVLENHCSFTFPRKHLCPIEHGID